MQEGNRLMKAIFRPSLLGSSAIAGFLVAGTFGSSAAAQEQAAPAIAPDAVTETIRVTGTRIQAPGVVANSPITTVGSEEFQFRQPVAVEELLRTLSVAAPAIGPGTNNGNDGSASIDLRNLGSNRNLVLMDGRRVVPFSLVGSVDTNVIPLALIERVDLVTGGAAAVYGSDAISGVVNFVLRDDFEGVEFSGSWGTSGEGDADRRRADVTVGGNFADGRGNAVVSVGYTLTDPLRQDERSIGLESINSSSGLPVGSGTSVPSFFNTPATGGNPTLAQQLCADPDTCQGIQIDPSTGQLVEAFQFFNFNPDNYYQAPLERYQMVGMANYEINRHAEIYLNALYVDSTVTTQLASSGTFSNTFDVPIGNPFIPEPMRQQLCANRGVAAADCVAGNPETVQLAVNRRLTELGPRLNAFDSQTFQYTAGVRGDIAMGWTYDAYYQWGRTDRTQTRGNWGSRSRVAQALNAVSTTECVDTSNGCVPLNVFGEEGTVTQEMVDFINLDATLNQFVEQEVLLGSVSGDFGDFASPWAVDPISTAFGYEYRRVLAGTSADAASQIQGEVLGTGAPLPDREGTFQLYEFFGEAIVPVVQDQAWARTISLELGARHTTFRSGGESDDYWTYKVGGEYLPVDDLRLRAMYQRATRAPGVNELFAPQVTGLGNLNTDPCAGSAPLNDTALGQLCVQTGVPQGALGALPQPSAGQVNVLTGGNPQLGPEVADTYTAGFVVQPSAIPGLTVSADYWLIEIEDAITAPSVGDLISQCYSTDINPNREFNEACQLILRSPLSGNLNDLEAPGIVLAQNNIGRERREGVDVNIAYAFDLAELGADPEMGSVALSLNSTLYTDMRSQPTPASLDRQCLGYYSEPCAAPSPDLKFTARAIWNVSAFDFSLQWRHLSSVVVEPDVGDWLPEFSRIPAYNYFDLSAGWNLNENARLNLTIANLTDESPPLVGNSIAGTTENSGNTFPQTYDVIGRYFTLGARVSF
ncbi:TonB-dependent receptor [Glycocaulis profundi]|nr:TonB-dependent receptor [Glycocaulis profundi]